ncbi:substrate-binding periplasmic protein [Litoreibacter roseus]|uniref:Amino acid ABC transporter substrate-binding protein n=1 Tax=Litoreibacter roseus TaxID=2601869 RepID=A0A6N6JDG6_9RHOB|nr:transporter substrate-binding domain-containing protein [Litoreibacter roseus]GFE64226.1 amino acid ABC transporter substrate-binding protein [Litoreibacter roseus]
MKFSIFAVAMVIAVPAWGSDPCADFVPQPKPQNAGRDIVGQELDQIVEQGHMLFAVYEDYPPYSWEEGGAAKGIDIEIARIIAEDLGVEARFNFIGSAENLEADLRNNIWKGALIGGRISNVMMRVPYDSAFACRVEQVVFTGQYAKERIAIAYADAEYPDEKPVPAYFRYDTVAVENDSISDFYLSGFVGGQLADNMRRYPDMIKAMDALAAGETKAAMGPRAQMEHRLADGLSVHAPPLAGFAVSSWDLGVAVNFRYRPLSYAVDDAIRYALDDGRIAGIFESYGLTYEAPDR